MFKTCTKCGREMELSDIIKGIKAGCEGCKLLAASEYYLFSSVNGGGFKSALCRTISAADSSNLVKLHLGFPREVEGYIAYSHGTDWDTFIFKYFFEGCQ